MIPNRRLLALVVCIVLTILASRAVPIRAQGEDLAMRIYELARDLYYQNTELQSYTSWVNGDIGTDRTGVPSRLRTGQNVPDFKFKLFNRAGEVTRSGLKGPYLLNFWASWCPPCRDEFPLLADSIENGDLTMPVIFVDVFDKKVDAQRFLWTLSTPVTIASDDVRSTFARKYGITSIPQTMLVDAKGKIQAIHTGGMTDLTLAFFLEIAGNPGVGAFNADNPDEPPADMQTGISD
jgi:cytochrome c biogenesis protein CcmG, thiol:disulfide interchange protein DsbE